MAKAIVKYEGIIGKRESDLPGAGNWYREEARCSRCGLEWEQNKTQMEIPACVEENK